MQVKEFNVQMEFMRSYIFLQNTEGVAYVC